MRPSGVPLVNAGVVPKSEAPAVKRPDSLEGLAAEFNVMQNFEAMAGKEQP